MRAGVPELAGEALDPGMEGLQDGAPKQAPKSAPSRSKDLDVELWQVVAADKVLFLISSSSLPQ